MPLAIGLGLWPNDLIKSYLVIQSVFTYFLIVFVPFFMTDIMMVIKHLRTTKKLKLS
jgi:hypothetical protein